MDARGKVIMRQQLSRGRFASAVVATIGNGAAFTKGRDFGAWLGLVPKQLSYWAQISLSKNIGSEHSNPASAGRSSTR
jgi:hypothetical protein